MPERAIDLFVYRITREIGSLVAALGGLDGLVFTAGIGENDVATRAEIIAGLAWAGLSLDEAPTAMVARGYPPDQDQRLGSFQPMRNWLSPDRRRA